MRSVPNIQGNFFDETVHSQLLPEEDELLTIGRRIDLSWVEKETADRPKTAELRPARRTIFVSELPLRLVVSGSLAFCLPPCNLGINTCSAARMFEVLQIGVIDLTTLRQKLDALRCEEARLNEEELRLKAELRQAQAQELNEEKLFEFCQSLPTVLTSLDFEGKRQILREVVDKIAIDGSEVTIYGIIPPTPEDIADDASIVLPFP